MEGAFIQWIEAVGWMRFFIIVPLGPFRKVVWLRLTERLQKGEYMNVNTQMRYGSSSDYDYKTVGKTEGVRETSEKSDNQEEKNYTVADIIEMLKQQYELTADDLEEKDWRDMSDKEWEKLLNSFDKNIDAIRDKIRKLKEVQDEAASKAAANAPAGQKANAASSAALSAAANGFASDVKTEDEEWIEENSWTYDMKTENQTILHKAAIANEKAQDSLSKSQELMLTGDTTEGVSKTEGATESASCDDESGEKVWTVTAYTEQGIICKEFKDGVGKLLWQIDFKNPADYNKVMDYLDNEKKEDILKYARDKEFWEKLIWG